MSQSAIAVGGNATTRSSDRFRTSIFMAGSPLDVRDKPIVCTFLSNLIALATFRPKHDGRLGARRRDQDGAGRDLDDRDAVPEGHQQFAWQCEDHGFAPS